MAEEGNAVSPALAKLNVGSSPAAVSAGAAAHSKMDMHRITVSTKPSFAQRFAHSFPSCTTFINNWFYVPEEDTRSKEQLEREKYLFGAPWSGNFERWMIVFPSFAIQLCIGSLYSWSIFNASMDALWGEVGANAQAFTIAIAAEGLATLLLSNFIERQGPYRCVLYSTMFAAPAWAFACLGTWKQEKLIVYILFGIPLGVAGAFGFVGCVANMQRWFPDYKGLAAGFTVMGFGFGAFMWQLVGNALMDPAGSLRLAAYQVHGIFAAIFICAMVLCLPFIRAPPPGFQPPPAVDPSQRGILMRILNVLFPTSKPTPADKPYTYLEAVFQLEFVLICIAMFGTFLPGVVFISSAADMTKYVFKKDPQYANLIAAMLNLMNFTGRIIWGVIAERIGRKSFYIAANLIQGCALGMMALWIHLDIFGLWLFSFFIVGSVYGGAHGILPAFLNQMFGSKIAGALHGTLLFVWAMADVVGVPVFSAIVAEHKQIVNGKAVGTPEAYMLNAYWLCAMPMMAAVVLIFLDTSARDRTLRKAFRECRVRCCHKVCVVKCLDEKAQTKEYQAYQNALTLHKRIRAGTATIHDETPDLELQAIPGLVDMFDVNGQANRAISTGNSMREPKAAPVAERREGLPTVQSENALAGQAGSSNSVDNPMIAADKESV